MKLYDNISNVLAKKGINLITGNMYDFMAIWKEWYRGSVNDFHYYKAQLADGTTCDCERLTMNMPKKVCEDIAKLLWTEKTQINLSNKKATERLWEILDCEENSFTVNIPIFIEKALAIGNGALVEYKSDNKTIIDYIEGDLIIPYLVTNSYIKGLITISRFIEENDEDRIYFTHITYHEFNGYTYTKYNELYKSEIENELGEDVDFATKFPNVENPYTTETKTPHFQVFRPNLANNLDMTSPLGISIFANSLDRFKAIDLKYDSFMNEFELGKKRILVDSSTLKAKVDHNANTGEVRYVQYFDKNDKVYVAVDGMEGQPAKEIDFNLRAQEHIDSINAELNWLSSNVGLGSNFYKFDGRTVSNKTIKEVMSENSEAFRTKAHHQIIVDKVIRSLVGAICELEGIKTKEIKIIHDDSMIEDKETEQLKAQQEVSQGLRSKKDYLTKIRGMSEEEAEKELEEIEQQKQSDTEMFGME